MRRPLIALIVLAALAVRYADGPNNPGYANAKQADNAHGGALSTKSQTDTNRQNQSTGIQPPNSNASAEWALFWAAVGTLIVLIYQAGKMTDAAEATRDSAAAARDTVEAINRQASIMERQTTAAERSITLLISRERPRIRVGTPKAFDVAGSRAWPDAPYLNVYYKIDCYCPTDAFIVDTSANAYLDGPFGSISFQIPIYDFDRVTVQSVILDRSTLIMKEVDNNFINLVNEDALHFRGFIKYRGVHLSDEEPPYITAFYYVWKYADAFRASASWVECGPPKDNQKT